MKKIIAFSGSNSSQSINQQLITIVAKYIKNVEVEIIDLRDYPAAVYSIDDEIKNGFPSTIEGLHEKIGKADGFIVSSPEHNGSMPAVLKNTIDWLSRMGRKVFNEKPTVFLSTSPGPRGGMSALQHLLAIMPYQGADVIGGHSIGSFQDKIANGELIKGEDRDKIISLMEALEAKV